MAGDLDLIGRLGLAMALAFLVGWEREVRGAPAGDRVFSLVGLAAAAVAALGHKAFPTALSGVVTGVGFIGGAVVFRSEGGVVRGITTAATIWATAAIGIACGVGRPLVGIGATVLVLLALEFRHLPFFRLLDARRFAGRFRDDADPPRGTA